MRACTAAPAWRGAAIRRRMALAALILLPDIYATQLVAEALPPDMHPLLGGAYLGLFALLFAWISMGFCIAAAGLMLHLRREPYAITRSLRRPGPAAPSARTAILMPIYHEEPGRVFAGLETMYRLLDESGQLEQFDFFVLSDSRDPAVWLAEEQAWGSLCRKLDAFGRIYYRRRAVNSEGKAGNIADFCRRWGAAYPYFIILDADSLMTGDAMLALVQMMERNPQVGLIQTLPFTVNRSTLFARAQQFTNRVHGPVFAAGLHYWQLGDGNYWGHNAILRTAPFMAHCGLPELPGKAPLGGHIMSHDFVEAALLRRTGWEVWLAYDLPGSYEESPPTLIDYLARDRRWCRGNLQHAKLLLAAGLHPMSRAHFANGILAYLTAPLWALLLLFGTLIAGWAAIGSAEAESAVQHPGGMLAAAVFVCTLLLLLLPKLFGPMLIAQDPAALRRFGGQGRLAVGVVLEIVLGTLMAPLLMMAHSRFVLGTLLGRDTAWGAQCRADRDLDWREAWGHYRLETGLALCWGWLAWHLDPLFFAWLSPVLLGLLLAAPLAVLSSSVTLGTRLAELGIWLIPEESRPPDALRRLRTLLRQQPARPMGGLQELLADPVATALHLTVLQSGAVGLRPADGSAAALCERVLREGAAGLSTEEQVQLLADPQSLMRLHQASSAAAPSPAAGAPVFVA